MKLILFLSMLKRMINNKKQHISSKKNWMNLAVDECPLLWRKFLTTGIAHVCQQIQEKNLAMKPKTLAYLKASLCTRSWSLYRVIRPDQITGESFAQWCKMFKLSVLINEKVWLSPQAELFSLQLFQQIANMVFETCQTLHELDHLLIDNSIQLEENNQVAKKQQANETQKIAPIFCIAIKTPTRHSNK